MSKTALKSAQYTPPSQPTLLCSHLTKINSVPRQMPEQDALLEEISRSGAVVSLTCPIKTGSAVKIDCRTCELRGLVTGCKHGERGYVAEIAFPADRQWQPAEFKPDGLFNTNCLICINPGCSPDCVDGDCTGL
jgi:hypothetical protein